MRHRASSVRLTGAVDDNLQSLRQGGDTRGVDAAGHRLRFGTPVAHAGRVRFRFRARRGPRAREPRHAACGFDRRVSSARCGRARHACRYDTGGAVGTRDRKRRQAIRGTAGNADTNCGSDIAPRARECGGDADTRADTRRTSLHRYARLQLADRGESIGMHACSTRRRGLTPEPDLQGADNRNAETGERAARHKGSTISPETSRIATCVARLSRQRMSASGTGERGSALGASPREMPWGIRRTQSKRAGRQLQPADSALVAGVVFAILRPLPSFRGSR